MPDLSLVLQTGTLYASNDASSFVGTGGPYGFSPFTSQFGGVVSSAGLTPEPFSDTVYSVAPGDEVIFVIAVQNLTTSLAAYDLGLRTALPAGFVVPAEGSNLTVTDGNGSDLAFTGDLFGAGLRLSTPLARYNADSGLNLVLVTYALAASNALPGPYASIASTASITHAATSVGGADQGIAASASTTVVSAAPSPVVQAETSAGAVAKGQAIAFDVSIAIPAGTMRDVRLDSVLPSGSASLKLLSTTVTGIGSGLQLGTPTISSNGSVQFGSITSTGNPAHNVITLRVVAQADGSASGTAVLQTVLSAAASDPAASRWSAVVGSSVGVVVPPTPPGITWLWTGQQGTPGTAVHPLGGLLLSDSSPAAAATIAVALRDGSLGRLSGGNAAAFNAAGSTFVMSGTIAALQAAARALVFTPAGPGTEQFTVTVVDPSGGIGQDASTALTIGGSAADTMTVAAGAALWVASLKGTTLLRAGATLQADRIVGIPVIQQFSATDRLVLPGTGGTLSYRQNGVQGGLLTVGGSTIGLSGIYDQSWFQLGTGDGGTEVVTLRADPLFDPAYYLSQNVDVTAAMLDPFQHYVTNGWHEGRAPLALFDTAYYLTHNPDVAASGLDPLLHFEANGWKEGRNPSPLFSLRDYLAVNPDVHAAELDPLVQYVQSGRSEGRGIFAASVLPLDPLIDLAAYYAANPDVRAAGADANDHYAINGWREGRNPNAFFDSRFYLAQDPDVRAAGVNPLQHFEAVGWKEGRQPSLLFDDAKYLAANPDVHAAELDPLMHFLVYGQGENRAAMLVGGSAPADPLVDAAFYDKQLGATLVPSGLAAAQQAAWSYGASGWQAGLNPDAWFDTQYYLARNPDVAAAHVNPLLHFEQNGWKEGRNPSALFDTRRYLAANPDVAAAVVDPLAHYVLNGIAEGRAIYPA